MQVRLVASVNGGEETGAALGSRPPLLAVMSHAEAQGRAGYGGRGRRGGRAALLPGSFRTRRYADLLLLAQEGREEEAAGCREQLAAGKQLAKERGWQGYR